MLPFESNFSCHFFCTFSPYLNQAFQMNPRFFLAALQIAFCLFSCNSPAPPPTDIYLTVLGIAQDAGYPQAGCQKACCQLARQAPDRQAQVACLGIVDPLHHQSWMIEATPDFPSQLQTLAFGAEQAYPLQGIFLTHAHIGHYSGLIHLGREVMGSQHLPVYAMPRMADFLRESGPWSQLVELNQIELRALQADSSVSLTPDLHLRPLLVPHRDEFSETVGYLIQGPKRQALFLPDIDKWGTWEQDINQWVQEVDFAFLDATFFANGELPGRDMSEIPHPFVEESMQLFQSLSPADKAKIHFIHLNHTNPLLDPKSQASQAVAAAGFRVAREGMRFGL
jgi:pyrroloquinoline quinone biosynthesis protein B